jgi:thioredoxin-related protein
MNRVVLIVIFHMISLSVNAQKVSGVQFESDMNWQSLLIEAKIINKLIFVYLSPNNEASEKMLKNVFINKEISEYVNKKFISTIIKLDTPSARIERGLQFFFNKMDIIGDKYYVQYEPTYLFFSSNGQIVHRGIGQLNENDFIKLIITASDSSKQYYTLLHRYLGNSNEYDVMPYLAYTAKELQDESMAERISKDYINNYLMKLPKSKLMIPNNIGFIADFLNNSKGADFDFFLKKCNDINIVMKKAFFSQNIIEHIITREEIDPELELLKSSNNISIKEPRWNIINNNIRRKYNGNYAKKTILFAKIRWYEDTENWLRYSQYVLERVEKYGPYFKMFPEEVSSVDWKLNSVAWDLFRHSSDRDVLLRALSFSQRSIDISKSSNAQYIDTYANILYRLGKVEDAIKWEERAIKLDPTFKEFNDAILKMKEGKPTWRVPASGDN